MLAVQKNRRISLALVALASAVAALGASGSWLRHPIAPGGFTSAVEGPQTKSSVSETPVEVSPSPPLSPRIPTQNGKQLAASVCAFGSVRQGVLIIPVAGVQPHQLRDTFHERRAAGHLHEALDIPAAHGTPVLAAGTGRILKLSHGPRGGIALYQVGCDGRMMYYYAHLDRYADGLEEGQDVHPGQVIGYVGDTGNAGVGNYHLHFSIALISDPKHYWNGENLNPYPLLKR